MKVTIFMFVRLLTECSIQCVTNEGYVLHFLPRWIDSKSVNYFHCYSSHTHLLLRIKFSNVSWKLALTLGMMLNIKLNNIMLNPLHKVIKLKSKRK
jgi:hypothetical protein